MTRIALRKVGAASVPVPRFFRTLRSLPPTLDFQLKGHRREGRKLNEQRMFTSHPRNIFTGDTAVISYVVAAVGLGTGMDDLAIEAGLGNAQAIFVTHHGCGVHHECDDVAF